MSVLPEKPSTILLADADTATAAALGALLESWNYQVELLADGAAAYKRLNAPNAPALAILDYELPSMKGFEVIAETRRRARQRAPWLMLMSGAPDLEAIAMATKAGVDDFLLKPVNEMDLLVRLRTAERVQHLYHELQEQMDAVRFHASHDSLTGYGTGDAVLREFAQRLRRYLRSYDILGRCGEDEFLVGLPGCMADQAVIMAERLQNTVLEKPYHIHRDVLNVTASIGLGTSRGRSPLIVLREAERALGNAKLAGRNCVRTYGQPTEPPILPEPGDPAESDQAISPS
jgi:two-component system cell cycle response regulator